MVSMGVPNGRFSMMMLEEEIEIGEMDIMEIPGPNLADM